MSLTLGRGPLSPNPAGHFDRTLPGACVYAEPYLRRVRAVRDERTLIDSQRVVLVHRAGQPPYYAFPAADVPPELPAAPEPAVASYVRVPWDAAAHWYEEEEEVFLHPRNPYHRIDCTPARRKLHVSVGGVVLVDTSDVICLYETSRSPRLYVRREAVRTELLVRSATVTYCPYKGYATHWSAQIEGTTLPDVAWSYDDPLPESLRIAGMFSFYPERTQLEQDVLDWFSLPAPSAR